MVREAVQALLQEARTQAFPVAKVKVFVLRISRHGLFGTLANRFVFAGLDRGCVFIQACYQLGEVVKERILFTVAGRLEFIPDRTIVHADAPAGAGAEFGGEQMGIDEAARQLVGAEQVVAQGQAGIGGQNMAGQLRLEGGQGVARQGAGADGVARPGE